jgi:hypothetical protein
MKTVASVIWAIIYENTKDALLILSAIAVLGAIYAFCQFALVPAIDWVLWIAGGR